MCYSFSYAIYLFNKLQLKEFQRLWLNGHSCSSIFCNLIWWSNDIRRKLNRLQWYQFYNICYFREMGKKIYIALVSWYSDKWRSWNFKSPFSLKRQVLALQNLYHCNQLDSLLIFISTSEKLESVLFSVFKIKMFFCETQFSSYYLLIN